MNAIRKQLRHALPLFVIVLVIAACAREDAKPPGQAQNSNTEVIVIGTASEQTEDERVVEFAKDEVNEGLTGDPDSRPHPDLAENPNDDPSDNESPHPNPDSTSSAVGLSGGIGGGGGRAGSGGFAHRRARGGGGSARAGEPVIETVRSNEPNPGTMSARMGDETIGVLDLVGTKVKAKVTGALAATHVTQTFTNPFDQPIEAVYAFPLPADGAVNEFVMQVGERRIIGIVRPRAEAEQAYKEARARGYTASLMTQERPNIFTQNVANIAVGMEVRVKFTFFQMLGYRDGRFEYVFPLTIGPRYIPPAKPVSKDEPEPVGMEGTATDNERVADAAKVTPPTLPPAVRSGRDVEIEIELAAGLPLDMSNLACVAHNVRTHLSSDGRASIKLVQEDTIANRDFVLRWRVLGEQPQAAVWTHTDQRGTFASLQLQPQLDPRDADVTPREITFLLDVSGSMSGEPTRISREVMLKVLDNMRPEDRFNIVTFASGSKALFEAPAENTPDNVATARTFLNDTRAGGGTNMREGFLKALALPSDSRYLGIYAFLTDGFIGNESEIHSLAKENSARARSFAFGIGSSVNRHLCDGIAEHGQGKAIYCLPRDSGYAEGAVEEFFAAIDSPVLCDISIDWGEMQASDFAPAVPRDLFAGQPLQVCARVEGKGTHTATVHGRVGGRAVSLPITINLDTAESHPAIAAIWARRKVDDLSASMLQDPENASIVQQISDLGVQFNLVTKYTAFIAVDESRVNSDGKPLRIMVPVEMPEGVTFANEESESGEPAPRAVKIEKWGLTLYERNGVFVAAVGPDSPAAKMGMVPGQQLLRVNGVEVTGLDQVERLLLQSPGNPEVQTRVNDEGAEVDAKFTLPDPTR